MFFKVKPAALIVCTTLFSIISIQVYSQKSLFLLGGIGFTGLPYNYKFQQGSNVLKRGWAFSDGSVDGGVGFNFSLAAHQRVSNSFAIEAGVEFSEMDLIVYDKSFMNRIGIKGSEPLDNFSSTVSSLGNFDAANWYRSAYVSGYYFVPSRANTKLYFNGGVSLNCLAGPMNMAGTYNYQETDENLILNTHYKSFYIGSFLESGICFNGNLEKGPLWFLGMRYYFARDVLSGDYSNIQNGVVKYSDHVDSSGSYLTLSLRVGGAIIRNPAGPLTSHHNKVLNRSRNNNRFRINRHKITRRRRTQEKTKAMPEKNDRSNTRGW